MPAKLTEEDIKEREGIDFAAAQHHRGVRGMRTVTGYETKNRRANVGYLGKANALTI